jgi:uncharacterized Zn-binding protein involved in type VI secretion
MGDSHSGGGVMVEASGFPVMGRKLCLIGDHAFCPTHNGSFPLVGGGSPSVIVMGRMAAFEPATLACGCTVISSCREFFARTDRSGSVDASRPIEALTATAAMASQALAPSAAEDDAMAPPEPKSVGKEKHVTQAQGQANIEAARRAILAAWDHGDFPEIYFGNHMKMRMDEFRTEKLTYVDKDNYSDVYGFNEGAHTHLDAYGWAGEMEFFRGSADTKELALEVVSHEFTHTLRSFSQEWVQEGRAYNRLGDVGAFRTAAVRIHGKMESTVKGIYSASLPYLKGTP